MALSLGSIVKNWTRVFKQLHQERKGNFFSRCCEIMKHDCTYTRESQLSSVVLS